ncbi:hypothetical protein [Arthrobacter methylotrophus]|uniref:Uncharacterized protein n=1 Tax=Arthrobacter methylotrophus TaxID=121291 RepID=A0ABV5UJR0_9MICC
MQIAEYLRGRQQTVEHVGSAHTEAELGISGWIAAFAEKSGADTPGHRSRSTVP